MFVLHPFRRDKKNSEKVANAVSEAVAAVEIREQARQKEALEEQASFLASASDELMDKKLKQALHDHKQAMSRARLEAATEQAEAVRVALHSSKALAGLHTPHMPGHTC